jgi:X-X-X-Leu-X-X-Gly heptad repeat protein
MRRSIITKGRSVFAVGAVAAMGAAVVLPGAASATTQGNPTASVTRAALIQTDASGQEVSRTTLITQIQVDGSGELNVEIPAVEGSSPSNMDSFGGPSVENGKAVYNLDVNGPETIRTSQSYDEKIPVSVKVTAKVDGRSVPMSELQNVTGKVELQYTAENLTSTPTEITYAAGPGPKTEEVDLTTAMGGTLDIQFPPSWTNIKSAEATVISGDGQGSTKFNAGYTLFEPFGTPKQTVTITADATGANLPPAVAQFSILEPKNNPTARALSQSLAGGAESGQTIYDGGAELNDGAEQLVAGLTTAVDGANQIADGVAGTLEPGAQALANGAEDLWTSFSAGAQDKSANAAIQLVDTVRSQPAYQQLLAGFDELNSPAALYKIQGILSKVIAQLGSPFDPTILKGGKFDSGSQTANSMISTLVFGGKGSSTPQIGITNPTCDGTAQNPCGVVQILDQQIAAVGAASAVGTELTKARNALVPAGKTLPGGCMAAAGAGYAFNDTYGCNYSPQQAAFGIVTGKTDISSLLLALGLSLGKGPVTTGGPLNPTLQIDPSFAIPGVASYAQTLKFGVCPGPNAAEDAVSTHCSAAQVLSFLAAGVSGTPAPGFTQTTNPGPLVSKPDARLTAATVWSDPVYGAVAPGCAVVPNSFPPNTIPPAPDTNTQVKPFGAACAVRTLQSSLNNILLPTIAEGVRAETVGSLGNGQFSPDCDPDVTPTITCGLSLLRAGTKELLAGVQNPLKPGTRQLADGLPAALDGVTTVRDKAAASLLESGAEATADFARQVALYDAMNNPELVAKYVPGGIPTGDNVRYNGVFKYELAGVGSQGTSTGVNFALGALGLLGAGGLGIWAANRRRSTPA